MASGGVMMNIAGTTPVEDPEYRYKMPRLVGKVEGRGNGIKTAIPNMSLVATALHRPPGEVTKFFGCELGAQTTWTEETERAIVNGAHTTAVLQDKLSIYIEKFVLCPNCRLPETVYKIKSEVIYHTCGACGFRGPVDMQHKLTTFILKSYKLEKKAREKDKSSKGEKKAKGDKGDKGSSSKGGEEDAGGGEEKKKKKKKDKPERTEEEKAERKRKKKEKAERAAAAAAAGRPADGSDDDDDDNNNGGGGDDDDDDEEDGAAAALEAAVNGLRAFLDKDPAPEAVLSELRALHTFSALPRNERAAIAVAALFPEPAAVLAPSGKAIAVLAALKQADSSASALLGGLEKLAVVHDALQPKFPVVLKKLYDADVLDEKDVLEWHSKGPDEINREIDVPEAVTDDVRALLLKATQPFVTWLQEAEEEGDDDEDDEGDD